MNRQQVKTTRRGFVMTGGGAKGLYEAGVIHAFHLCGLEFDVITGSSIGAMNAVFFAEYLYQKKRLPNDVQADPLRALEAMDPLVKAFLHAWWQLPDAGVVDDSEQGPLGRLKKDLLQFNVDLPLMVRLLWWWTDPHRWKAPPPSVWPHLLRLGNVLVKRLDDGSTLFDILDRQRHAPAEVALRAYLARFDLERSLVPAQPNVLRDYFTRPFTPLQLAHLVGARPRHDPQPLFLLDGRRTMRDYAQEGIDVRLTRANFRTGRLELSAYTPLSEFLEYLEGRDPNRPIIIGSSRVVVPGNPGAVDAAIASGRFPGVFAPYAITEIYARPRDAAQEPENALLYELLEHGLEGESVRRALYEAYTAANPQMETSELSYVWEHVYPRWTATPLPRMGDTYVDGGAIDNTPTNSAVDAVREAIDRRQLSRRDYRLDLYVVFLHKEPNPGVLDKPQDPALYQVVSRTLGIQGAAKMTSDAGVVQTINRFGDHGEELGRQLQILLQSLAEALEGIEDELPADLEPQQRAAVLESLRRRLLQTVQRQAQSQGLPAPSGDNLGDLLAELQKRRDRLVSRRLPLHVEPVEIYPDDLNLETLQFTERLGFRGENAIEGMTMGCYNTLWRVRLYLEQKATLGPLDEVDSRALDLARTWMGFDRLPATQPEQEALRRQWRCRREACVFHPMHCRHGKQASHVVHVQVARRG